MCLQLTQHVRPIANRRPVGQGLPNRSSNLVQHISAASLPEAHDISGILTNAKSLGDDKQAILYEANGEPVRKV